MWVGDGKHRGLPEKAACERKHAGGEEVSGVAVRGGDPRQRGWGAEAL